MERESKIDGENGKIERLREIACKIGMGRNKKSKRDKERDRAKQEMQQETEVSEIVRKCRETDK